MKKWSLGYLAENGLIIHDYRTGGDHFPFVMHHSAARMIFAGTDNERSAQPGCAQTGLRRSIPGVLRDMRRWYPIDATHHLTEIVKDIGRDKTYL